MSDVTFGLSPERMKQLLECKAEVGLTPAKPPQAPARKPKAVKAVKVAISPDVILAKVGLDRKRVQSFMAKVEAPKPEAKPKAVKVRKVRTQSYDYQRANDPRLAGMTDDEIRRFKVKLYQQKHRKKFAAYHKAWREANRDKMRATALRYYRKNKERLQSKMRLWQKNNPEKAKAIARRYRLLRKLRDLA